MVPTVAAENIPHLLISTTENGVQDHKYLLEAYKEFNEYLKEKKIQKPVVVLTDGHSSRFHDSVLEFCIKEFICLFVGQV